jgi:hypothetical protein
MRRTTDSVRPRHHNHHHHHHHPNNAGPRSTTSTVGETSGPASNNNNYSSIEEEGCRLNHKKRPSAAASTRWPSSCRKRTMIQRILFIIIAAPLIIHFLVLLTMVGSSTRRSKSSPLLWPFLSSSSNSFLRKEGGADHDDPMQSFVKKPPQQRSSHSDQGERQEQQVQPQASSSTIDNSVVEDARPSVVGTFQGLPVTYHEIGTSSKRFASSVHCVGENFQTENAAWMVRSCQFRNLCFDMNTNDFVLFQSAEEERLQQLVEKLQKRHQKKQQTQCQQQPQKENGIMSGNYCQRSSLQYPLVTISTLALQNHTKVSLGSLHNLKWTTNSDDDVNRLQWFPKVLPRSLLPRGYYQLPNDVVWIPFIHVPSSSMMNAGNLVWNDWFSIYTLLSMFDLLGNNDGDKNGTKNRRRLLLMRHVLKEPLSAAAATCDFNAASAQHCRVLLEKFLPAMGIYPPLQFSTNLDYQWTLFQQPPKQQQSHLICARYGAAGIGMLSSSSSAAHRSGEEEDATLQSAYYKDTFNMGRGATLRAFGKFMARNLGILSNDNNNNNNDPPGNNGDSSIEHSFTVPYKITIISDSSARPYSKRDLDHDPQQTIALLQKEFASGGSGGAVNNDNDVVIQSFDVQQLTLVEQARIASESVIFVSVCGVGSVMAAFLSPGASLIIYDEPGHESGNAHQDSRQQEQSARTDWNLLSNAGYFRTHWMPLQRSSLLDWNTASLVDLIHHELDRIRYESRSTSSLTQ